MAKGDLVFLDTETTGLNYGEHRVIELAYMTQDMKEPAVIFPYKIQPETPTAYPMGYADPKAMEINKFYDRYPNGVYASSIEDISDFLNVVEGSTLVGANIRFDARMIEYSFQLTSEPWHHRLFDLEAYAAGVFGWSAPRGWKEICDNISTLSASLIDDRRVKYMPTFDVSPDHSAAADTLSVKQAYDWLVWYRDWIY
jgi:DNA polymerase-3 subunit epsilon